jgi:branched-chain amino acid transport system permease protein
MGSPLVEIYLQLLINGLLFGTMYGIAAMGLSLIFGTMQIIFITQGAMIVFWAYVCFWLFTLFSMDPYLSMILILPAAMVSGVVLYQVLFRKVARAGKNPSLLIAFGVMVLLENLMSVLWTPDTRAVRTAYTAYGIKALGLRISLTRLIGLGMALIAMVGVSFFLKRTLMGKAVRAASEDLTSASLMGITPHRVNSITFAFGIGLAGVAGIATAAIYPFDPYFGYIFSLKALIAVALGGVGSVGGALLGGILIGIIESVGSFLIGGVWADAISYSVFLIVLMFRPEGLFGQSSNA